MVIRFADKLAALFALCDAEIEAQHDREDGYDPDTLLEQWERAARTLGQPRHEALLLLALMSSEFVHGRLVDQAAGRSNDRACPLYTYAGLTEAGRAVAVRHGWTDIDEVRHPHLSG